jgi:hypothetical protein
MDAYSAMRGSTQIVVLGTKTLTTVLTSAQYTFMSEPTTMAQFVFNFSIVNHDL